METSGTPRLRASQDTHKGGLKVKGEPREHSVMDTREGRNQENGWVWEGSILSKTAEWSIKIETKKHSIKASIGYWWETS